MKIAGKITAGFLSLCFVCLLAQSPQREAPKLQAGAGSPLPSTSGIRVQAIPARPWIERRGDQQLINFDLLVENHTAITYRLVNLKLQVLDSTGRLELEREVNENGHPPALDIVGGRVLRPGEVLDLFEPFTHFDSQIELSSMRFELLFMEEGHASPPAAFRADASVSIEVDPRRYTPPAYCLPLRGHLLVHDGHDLFSHHRRYNLVERYKADPASAVSANLYAYDFVRVDDQGKLFHGSPESKEDWLSYGEPVYAPTSGLVLAAVSDIAENSFSPTGGAQLPSGSDASDPNGLGNHVTLRGADGRVSWMLHMQPGSVMVKAGQHIRAGQPIGKVGFSGDSLFPHLHFNVTEGSGYPSQGLPSYFRDLDRILGARRVHVNTGQVDSGDLLESGPCDGRANQEAAAHRTH